MGARGWTRMLREVKQQAQRDRLSLVCAGVAFYAMLATFPSLAALISLYGLAFDPQQISAQLASLEGALPQQALELLLDRLKGFAQSGSGTLGWGLAASLALVLWSASKGVKTLMEALNVVYGEREERGFLKRNALALLLTLGAVLGAGLAIAAVVLLPALVRLAGLEGVLGELLGYARWPILAAAAVAGIALLYRYGPSRERAGWRRVGRGALIATMLWIVGSVLFSLYVSSFGNYNEIYGSVAAVIVLLLWFLVSAYAILLGAEINAELERSGEAT